MPGARKVAPGSIAAKRRQSRVSNIKARAEAGKDVSNERAYIRVGKRNTRILTGQEDLSEWSDEELKRGQRRDKNGRWQGRPPSVVPKPLHDELVRRTLKRANDVMRDSIDDAVKVLTNIVNDESVEPKDRLRAINMVLERVMGKTPDKVEVSGEAPWQIALNAGIVNVTGIKPEPDDEAEDEVED